MIKKIAALAAATLLTAPQILSAETPAAAAPASDWSFNISPYIWVAAVRVETSLDDEPAPPSGPSTPSGPDRYESKLGGGALLAAQVHYKSVGLWVDFVWIQTDTSAVQAGPFYSAKDLETNFYHSTVALSYILPTTGNFRAEILAGARYWSVDAEITAAAGTLPGFSARQKETWVTPVVGIDCTYDFNPKWSLLAKGTAAIGGHDSDGWEIMGGIAYRFGDSWSTSLGYRYLNEDYNRQRFAYTTKVSGVILGVSCRF